MVCVRCGYEIANDYRRPICPVCGTLLQENARAQWSPGATPRAGTHTGKHTVPPPEFSTSQTIPGRQSEQSEGTPPYSSRTFYQQGVFYAPATPFFWLRSYHSALLTEFLLSLVGIFGVGWLLAGETGIGLVLLACSILLYWPVMVLGTIFTLGLGLICLGPFATGAIICNTFLLSRYLKRKAKRIP